MNTVGLIVRWYAFGPAFSSAEERPSSDNRDRSEQPVQMALSRPPAPAATHFAGDVALVLAALGAVVACAATTDFFEASRLAPVFSILFLKLASINPSLYKNG